ncbi:hypothetical protein D3C87_1145240 [compost metagenome]
MKLLVILVSIFGSMMISSAAFAAEDKCVLTFVDSSTTTTTVYEMELRQHPRADIPSYVLETTHEGFEVFAIEADGNFWGHIRTASGVITRAPAQENGLSLAATEGDQALYMECF